MPYDLFLNVCILTWGGGGDFDLDQNPPNIPCKLDLNKVQRLDLEGCVLVRFLLYYILTLCI